MDDTQDNSILEAQSRGNVRSHSEPPIAANPFDNIEASELSQIDTEGLFRYPSAQDVSTPLHEDSLDAITLTHQSPDVTISSIVQNSPSRLAKRPRSALFGSPSILNPITSSQLSINPSWPFSSAHEGRLFHYYIKHCAPWVCNLRLRVGMYSPASRLMCVMLLSISARKSHAGYLTTRS